MKRILILMAVGALCLTACTEREEMEDSLLRPITFETSVGKHTRYIVDGEAYPDGINFGIWSFLKAQGASGYDYATPFMNDSEIKKFDSGWVTKEDYYYWPVYGQLKFVAYSPYAIGTPTYSEAEGLKFVDISPYYGDNTTGYDDIDFMFTEDASATDKTIADAPVGLLFKHALTQIRVTAKTALTNVVFTVKEIKVGQIKDEGTFQTLPTPQWSNLKTQNASLAWFILFKGTQVITTAEEQVGLSVLFIPQPIAGMEVRIKYEVTYNGITEPASKTIPLAGSDWAMNQKIKYALVFSMNEVVFTPAVNDWSTGADVPVAN